MLRASSIEWCLMAGFREEVGTCLCVCVSSFVNST